MLDCLGRRVRACPGYRVIGGDFNLSPEELRDHGFGAPRSPGVATARGSGQGHRLFCGGEADGPLSSRGPVPR
eukprot:2463487-Lingulodinium_polyedra.AAC.1